MVRQGVQALPDMLVLVRAVRMFDMFTPDNDPFGEHDFGSINWYDNKTYWKIDYYDASGDRNRFWKFSFHKYERASISSALFREKSVAFPPKI
jgi:hypothetical protein